MEDAEKFVTQTGQPAIFIVAEVNKKWFESLPKDLQQIIEKDAAEQSAAVNPPMVDEIRESNARFTANGGELITLPPAEQTQMMNIISSVAADVSSRNAALAQAYKIVADAAARTREPAGQ
jgi:TRAP-type C4-dicarboxylate transport system substrate-binding protein